MACSNEELLMKLQRLDSLPKNMTIDRFVKEVKHTSISSSTIQELEAEYKVQEKKERETRDKKEKEFQARLLHFRRCVTELTQTITIVGKEGGYICTEFSKYCKERNGICRNHLQRKSQSSRRNFSTSSYQSPKAL